MDFVVNILACLRLGVIAVPVTPIMPARFESGVARLNHILEDSGARCILTNSTYKTLISMKRLTMPSHRRQLWHRTRWHCLSTSHSKAKAIVAEQPISGDTVAFLQYTSGSTGNGKGVVVSHRCLLAQERLLRDSCDFLLDGSEVVCSWLPLYHDMGLIGVVFLAVYVGMPCYLMSPLTFLQAPAVYARTLSRVRATHSAVPNFALHLLTTRVREDQLADVDLSSLRCLVCGAEPIQPRTVHAFTERQVLHKQQLGRVKLGGAGVHFTYAAQLLPAVVVPRFNTQVPSKHIPLTFNHIVRPSTGTLNNTLCATTCAAMVDMALQSACSTPRSGWLSTSSV